MRRLLPFALVAALAGPAAPAPAPATGPAPWLRKNAPALLEVRTRTPGATVFIDGVERSAAPADGLKLKPGAHVVELKAPGHRDARRRLMVRAGERVQLSLDLQALPALAAVAQALPLPGEQDLPPLVTAAPGPSAPAAVEDEGPGGGSIKGARSAPAAEKRVAEVPEGAAPLVMAEVPPPLVAAAPGPEATGSAAESASGPASASASGPASAPAPAPPRSSGSAPVSGSAPAPAPAAALAASPAAPAPAGGLASLTRKWWFWGGVGAAALLIASGVVYALPPSYVETRNPAAACSGTCGVVVNK